MKIGARRSALAARLPKATVLYSVCKRIFWCFFRMFVVLIGLNSVPSRGEEADLFARCGVEESRNRSGDIVVFSKLEAKQTIVDKATKNLSRVQFISGHAYETPMIKFQNNNKFGVSALALGFSESGTIKKCSRNPKDYQAVFLCKSAIAGLGVGSGEYGSLDCRTEAKSWRGHDFCIIGFSPSFDVVSGGLVESMESLGMCD